MDVEQLRANYTAPGMGKQINDIRQDYRAIEYLDNPSQEELHKISGITVYHTGNSKLYTNAEC